MSDLLNNPPTVSVTIGGEAILVPAIMNFATLERVWPAIDASVKAKDAIEQTSANIAVISAALLSIRPDLTVAEIKKRLRINVADGSDERPGLTKATDDLITLSGLVPAKKSPAPGEDQPPAAETPAAETTETLSDSAT